MVYRSYVWFTKQLHNNDEKNLSCVSKLAADSWKDMSDQARAPFQGIATEAKRKHAELYPNYKYAPAPREDKPSKPSKKNTQPTSKARERANLKAVVAASTKERLVLSSMHKRTGAGSSSKSLPTPGPASTNEVLVLSPSPKRATAGSSSSPPIGAARTSPVATSSDERLVLSPLPIRGTWTAAWTTRALFYGEPPSPSPSCSSSSTSSTPLSTPELRPVSSRELGYVWDCDLPGYPPKPRFRAQSISSPTISELDLNEDPSFWPDVSSPF
jgi:HMG (high mobility group) box